MQEQRSTRSRGVDAWNRVCPTCRLSGTECGTACLHAATLSCWRSRATGSWDRSADLRYRGAGSRDRRSPTLPFRATASVPLRRSARPSGRRLTARFHTPVLRDRAGPVPIIPRHRSAYRSRAATLRFCSAPVFPACGRDIFL